ncbi:hypothetical protein HU200_005435 [Digitaria exilis]|uniref:Uncharacterized protein n=1 Tax=Digitaria exilis TaxID=1010633 RepID=A0A835KU93_9POAL|nr:hypothetical protein HU200_005435 [Digitaria exilis]
MVNQTTSSKLGEPNISSRWKIPDEPIPAANIKTSDEPNTSTKWEPVMRQRPAAKGRPQMNQIHAASILHLWLALQRWQIEDEGRRGRMKALPQKLTGSRSKVTAKQEKVPVKKVIQNVATKKVNKIYLSTLHWCHGQFTCGEACCAGDKECHLMMEAAEESQQILRRARKRRRREMQAIVPAA